MTLLLVSFLAGGLTVLAPCILPLLPIIVGGSISEDPKYRWRRPLTIAGSLAASVILFTLLLKASTSLLGVPTVVWSVVSGIIVILLGISLLAPELWESIIAKTKLNVTSQKLLSRSTSQRGWRRDVLVGAALGPVFSSCSPTYALIVAVVLPQTWLLGFSYLVAYALGLALILFLIGVLGQSLVARLSWASNPKGWLMRLVGVSFIIVGVAVLFGIDKQIQTYVLDNGWYEGISNFEKSLKGLFEN